MLRLRLAPLPSCESCRFVEPASRGMGVCVVCVHLYVYPYISPTPLVQPSNRSHFASSSPYHRDRLKQEFRRPDVSCPITLARRRHVHSRVELLIWCVRIARRVVASVEIRLSTVFSRAFRLFFCFVFSPNRVRSREWQASRQPVARLV